MFRFIALGIAVTTTLATTHSSAQAQAIQFVERYALAEDRQAVLQELVPGTQEYYFFHALHFQNIQQFDEAAETLDTWQKRLGKSANWKQISHRQALLTYSDDPQASLDYLIDTLDLRFAHQRQQSAAESGLPTVLDQSLIEFDRLNKRALSRNNTDRFEDVALSLVASQDLNDAQLRHLLQRLRHPGIADLPKLIDRDLRSRDAKPFGSYSIHQMLTLDQLDQLLKLQTGLTNQNNLVNNYLSRLLPNEDTNWILDNQEHVTYLDRLWAFVKNLNGNFNSLKACVLYRRLSLDMRMGVYDKQRFMDYLKLPRQAYYVRKEVYSRIRERQHLVNLESDYSSQIRLAPIRNDEVLVRRLLHHFLTDAVDYQEFESLIELDYLKQRFAEAKITAGLGDVEQWASLLSPQQYQALVKRVDLEFAATNAILQVDVDQPVELTLTTKNVDKLIVKIFEINTANYYRSTKLEIDTKLNLDGLVPNWQQTFEYDEPAARRVERKFKFDQMDHVGVYIVDFIGNGKSSRALIRKGALTHLVETTAVGHVFTVFDANKTQLKDASIWIAERQFQADENGKILVPFSTQPKREAVILEHGGLSVLGQFDHLAENYQLTAGFYVDREQLLKREGAEVVIRPQLRVSGQPTALALLSDVSVMMRAVDLDGVESTKEFQDVKFAEEYETTLQFTVPKRLRQISFTINAKVQSVSLQEKQTLSAAQQFQVNEIDTTQTLHTVHLRQNPDGYALAVRGKTGERRPAQPVLVKLKHRCFKEPVLANLQSDQNGQIDLGALADITSVEVVLEGRRKWDLRTSAQTNYRTLNASTEQKISIPFASADDPELALFEMRGGNYFRLVDEGIAVADGLITIEPLSAGDYELRYRNIGRTQRIQVTKASAASDSNWLMGDYRTLEVRQQNPLHIKEIETGEETVRIKLGGDGSFCRVHVFASRYQPYFDAYQQLATVGDVEPFSIQNGFQINGYVAGRTIGEEYQYILNRQFQIKYPGNMLTRPSLLLNPWELRTTENNQQVAAAGGEFDRAGSGPSGGSRRDRKPRQGRSANGDFANLDFLAQGSLVFANLEADEDGVIEIDRKLFEEKHMLQIVVQNHFHTLYRQAVLPESALRVRDLRLTDGLDPERHFAQQKQFQVLDANEPFELQDVGSAKFQMFNSLKDIYRFYVSLTGNQQLNQFGFLMDWPAKTEEEKLELYKRFACHEFNFFLMKKDPDYFQSVILPYLENKLDKTFLDQYLLDAELDSWVQPWEFQRLNTVEQVLLGKRVDDHRSRLNQFIGDDYDNSPTSRRQFDRYFGYIFANSALDFDEDSIALNDTRNRLQSGRLFEEDEEELLMESENSERSGNSPSRQPNNERPPRLLKPRENVGQMSGDRDASQQDGQQQPENGRGRAGRGGGGFGGGGKRSLYETYGGQARDKTARQYYQRIKPTEEWVENNYYRLPVEQQNRQLVTVNRFWRDFALHNTNEPFLSVFFSEASGNFTEMMFALSVMDLPFEEPENETEFNEKRMVIKTAGDVIAFYEQVRDAAFERAESTVLISENFFRMDDRYRIVDGKQQEKFVRKEFISNVVYGGQVVITNPTSTAREVDLLLQIPVGAVPTAGTHETKSTQLDMEAFSTKTLEYYFYFPTKGDFPHFPAHVSSEASVVAVADGLRFNVVEEPSEIDTESWAFISQNGTEQQVLDYLADQNLQNTDLTKIAFRMKDKEFFEKAIELLSDRFYYNDTLWSYALKHDDRQQISHYLKHANSFVNQTGPYLVSSLLTVEPVIRHAYQHREYWPLVNARAHQLGADRMVLNPSIWKQYHELLDVAARQTRIDDRTRLAITYYLMLQDRITEALQHFDQVQVGELETRLQYDYCAAYLAMYREKPGQADQIAKKYSNYPVKRWRDLFLAISAQVAEINGGQSQVVDAQDANQRQAEAADKTPEFEFVVEAKKTEINYQSLSEVTINYYEMDVELLFSRNPFVKRQDESFALIKPNATETIALPEDESSIQVDLPEQFLTSNVLVEVVGGGKTRRQAYYANSMNVQTIEQYGQVKVSKMTQGNLLPKVYVKVYARKNDGSVHFYKDGYTDLRGRFDYSSLSNQDLNDVDRFAILVISSEYGAVVREASVPKE